jgi:transcriptional regulator with XRE-family HTH domain
MRAVHNLSKEARLKIIEMLVRSRGKENLARELGISITAINKFLKGSTHPSDRTIINTLKIANENELKIIYKIMFDDLLQSIDELLENIKKLKS